MVFPDSNNRSLEAFKAKMQAALEANKNKNKAAKAKKHQQALVTRQGMVKEILRTQRYLGLLPKKQDDSALPDIGNLAVEPIDVRAPSPHIFESEPIFIAIDCEAWEKPPRPVTEVGMATLDTRDLEGWPPGPNGENWHQHIRGRHFRIIEWRDCVNSEYVQGCPNAFEFGHSELVGQDSIGSMLASCFREPFSKKLSDGTTAGEAQSEEKRNIIVVGHDLSQDINYCHAIGFSILNRGNILDTLDTVNMHRAYSQDPNARSLGQVLAEFDLAGWHLHNAGNDAVYTLQAMLAIAVKAAAERGSKEAETKREVEVEKRAETAVEIAKVRSQEDSEGWESTSGDDGGVPLPKTEADYAPKAKGGRNNGMQGNPVQGPHPSGLYTIGGAPLDV